MTNIADTSKEGVGLEERGGVWRRGGGGLEEKERWGWRRGKGGVRGEGDGGSWWRVGGGEGWEFEEDDTESRRGIRIGRRTTLTRGEERWSVRIE